MDVACGLFDSTPFWDDVHALYALTKARIQERNYRLDLRLRKLKECP